MVPKLHKKGASFKGAAAYLLHDKGRVRTAKRIEWTQARNIAVNDTDMAWRIMAATAMDQDRLKYGAGIKPTGRKSSTPVLHLTLAWHPEEKDILTQQQMKIAATEAINALGAQDHQALIIAHNDEDHPHIHILLNRVNPNDGRMLSSSKEKLNLSRWAEAYEKERGKIYCEDRVLNNEARDQGEYTRGRKDEHRYLFEEIKSGLKIANDNQNKIQEMRKRQKAADALLAYKGRMLTRKHADEWQALNADLVKYKNASKSQVKNTHARMISSIQEAYKPAWSELHSRQKREIKAFEARETKMIGRAQNVVEAVTYSLNPKDSEDRTRISDVFKVIAWKDARLQMLFKKHKSESRALSKEQRAKEQKIKMRMRELSQIMRARISLEYLSKRDRLIKAQNTQRESLRQEWRQRRSERRRDWHDLSRKTEPKEKLISAFTSAAEGFAPRKELAKERIKQRLREARDKDKGRDGR
jgi:relaxase-like protein